MFFVLTDHGFLSERYLRKSGIVCVTMKLDLAKGYYTLKLAQADCRSVPDNFNPFVVKLDWDTGYVKKVEVDHVK